MAEESYAELLFVCIFWFLHFTFSLTEYLMAFCYLLSAKWKSLFSQEKCLDMEQVKNFSKIPKHIAFLVLENDIVYDDLASLVVWSLLVGINVISLYDVHGKLKKNQGTLLGAINKEYRKYAGQIEPFRLLWKPHDTDYERDQNQTVLVNKNGMMYPDTNGNGLTSAVNGSGSPASKRSVSISLLSKADGKEDLVGVARTLGREILNKTVSSDSIDLDQVGSRLRTNQDIPDPCILVRLGSLASNLDFLPWQTRLTEMYSLPSVRNITPCSYNTIIRQFARCQQRLGK